MTKQEDMGLKTLTLHMPADLYDELQRIKAVEGIPVAVFIKKACRERLDTWVAPSERPYGEG